VIAYFDTSAVVPLLVAELGSTRAASLWDSADRVVSVRLVYPETRAALAQAERLGRLTARQLRDAVVEFDSLFEAVDLVEVDDALARRAGELAEVRRLRGYDAVHLAAAERIRDPDVVVVAGDRALLDAATAEAMAVAELPWPRPSAGSARG
jgi:predicted nucleic acid-binding protein